MASDVTKNAKYLIKKIKTSNLSVEKTNVIFVDSFVNLAQNSLVKVLLYQSFDPSNSW